MGYKREWKEKDDKIGINKMNIRGRLIVKTTPDYLSIPQDNIILENYGINELSFDSVKKYREKFSSIKPNHPWNGLEIKDFLYKIGAWGKVRDTNKEGLTLAGLLMFSEERVITEILPQYFLEYREYTKDLLNEEWSQRFTSQDGTWSGNVFDFYFKVSEKLVADLQDDIAMPGERTTILSCLYESLINALVHTDYYGGGGIVIEREKELFRFSNPGLFRISLEQALEGNISNLRNPNLFKMFILIGLCKRTGSGLKGIATAWKKKGEDTFHLSQDIESERTVLTLYTNKDFEETKKLSVNDTEHDPFLFSEEDSPIIENFVDLQDSYNNELSSVNTGESSYNNEDNSINNQNNSYNKEFNSFNSGINSYNKGDNSVNSQSNSYNKEDFPFVEKIDANNSYNSEKADDTTFHLMNVSEPGEDSGATSKEIEEKLFKISELSRRKKRLSPDVMEQIIIELCNQKPLMLKELADLLGRTPDGLRNNYLAKLLTKRKLKLKYPNQINHPKQAYMINK